MSRLMRHEARQSARGQRRPLRLGRHRRQHGGVIVAAALIVPQPEDLRLVDGGDADRARVPGRHRHRQLRLRALPCPLSSVAAAVTITATAAAAAATIAATTSTINAPTAAYAAGIAGPGCGLRAVGSSSCQRGCDAVETRCARRLEASEAGPARLRLHRQLRAVPSPPLAAAAVKIVSNAHTAATTTTTITAAAAAVNEDVIAGPGCWVPTGGSGAGGQGSRDAVDSRCVQGLEPAGS